MSTLSLVRTTVHSRRAHPCQAVFVGPAPRPCPAAGQWRGPRERCGRHHSRHQLRCQASKDYYEILSVSPDASQKEIKSAYKKKALKLHPDVNKAPDARERFMECKIAYDTLGKPELRAEYDRKRRGGSFSGGWDFKDDPTWKRAAGAAEEFSFEDLLRELDMTFADWSRERKQKRGDKPYTVWDGLADVTDEFLSFLEDELGANEADQAKGGSKAGPGASASSASGSSGQARREYTGTSYTASSSGARPGGAADAGAKKKSDQEEIDEMLAEMKRKMGL